MAYAKGTATAAPIAACTPGAGGLFTNTGAILVLFILLVIISKALIV